MEKHFKFKNYAILVKKLCIIGTMEVTVNNLPYTAVKHSLVDVAVIFFDILAVAVVIRYLKMYQEALFQLLLLVIF